MPGAGLSISSKLNNHGRLKNIYSKQFGIQFISFHRNNDKLIRFRQNPFLCETGVKKAVMANLKSFKPYVVSIDLQSAIIQYVLMID
jgi:hypothetical protein